MANFYLRSTDGSDADNGTTWALAKAKLEALPAVMSAGDTAWISQAHAESGGAPPGSLTIPGTRANPSFVYGGNDAAAPPTALSTGNSTTYTAGTFNLNGSFTGNSINITLSGATGRFAFASASGYSQVLRNCTFSLGTGGAQYFQFGGGSGASELFFENTTLNFGSTAQTVWMEAGIFRLHNVTFTGSAVTALFSHDVSGLTLRGYGVDMSSCAANVNIFSLSVQVGMADCELIGVKLPASFSGKLVSVAPTGLGCSYAMYNAISDTTKYRVWTEHLSGTVRDDTTYTLTATDEEGTAYSLKMTSTANCGKGGPLSTPIVLAKHNAATTSTTFTVEILHDSATNLKDDEIWLDLFVKTTTGSFLLSKSSDFSTNPISPSDQTASTAAWSTTVGLTNPNKQKLSVTVTPAVAGLVYGFVRLAKASKTVYVNPLIE